MVLCEEPVGDFVQTAPALIAETLSPPTRKKDLTFKRDLYASEGVKFYLVADPDQQEVQMFRL